MDWFGFGIWFWSDVSLRDVDICDAHADLAPQVLPIHLVVFFYQSVITESVFEAIVSCS